MTKDNVKKAKKEKTSKYNGVSKHGIDGRFVAQTKIDQKAIYLGLFNTEEQAALAYDQYIYWHAHANNLEVKTSRLNFGIPDISNYNPLEKRCNVLPVSDGKKTSRFRGVSWYETRKCWKASIQIGRKKEFIGRFETEEQAAKAYNKKATELGVLKRCYNVPDTSTSEPATKKILLTTDEPSSTSLSYNEFMAVDSVGLFFLGPDHVVSPNNLLAGSPSPFNLNSPSPSLL